VCERSRGEKPFFLALSLTQVEFDRGGAGGGGGGGGACRVLVRVKG